ncbi:uncharacterized protein ACNLHF_012667 [Anomaloglossus baeobatrachus]
MTKNQCSPENQGSSSTPSLQGPLGLYSLSRSRKRTRRGRRKSKHQEKEQESSTLAVTLTEANKEPEEELVTVDLSLLIHCPLRITRCLTISWTSWKKTSDKPVPQKGIPQEGGFWSTTNLQVYRTSDSTSTENTDETDNCESLLVPITTAGPGTPCMSSSAAVLNCMWVKLHRRRGNSNKQIEKKDI